MLTQRAQLLHRYTKIGKLASTFLGFLALFFKEFFSNSVVCLGVSCSLSSWHRFLVGFEGFFKLVCFLG